MDDSLAARDNRAVQIDRIISRAFSIIRDNPVVLLGLSFVLIGIPSLVINLLTRSLRGGQPIAPFATGQIVLTIVAGLAVFLFYILAQAAIVRASVIQADGRTAEFGESIMGAIPTVLPLIGLSLLVFILGWLGLILIVVPGIILFVMWSAAYPALVAERIGVFAALRRSRTLTKGARWKVFGVELIAIVLFWLISSAVSLLLVAGSGGLAGLAATAQAGAPIWYLALSTIIQAVLIAFWGTLQTSLYLELRDWKDGPAGAALAEVFA